MPDIGGPRYRHDCNVVGYEARVLGGGVAPVVTPDHPEACRFIGRFREYDLYVHVRDYTVECVARHGNDGPDYLSGPSVARMIAEFVADDG